MYSFLSAGTLEIKSLVILDQRYLRLQVETGNRPCGAIDFIAGKINFNISSGTFIFKGMEHIKDITFEYKAGNLVFIFSNTKTLSVECRMDFFEKISAHIETYSQANNHQAKDFFSNN
ncbi:hypothetical protein [Polluticaenibacter yanchengensis]|uniref:YokE-like PH domain-containing protein n=1 Tax=Polluticaenibacter yanchengensis TaxID=3014562 RepID=A0ABT4UF12_9BACT|nr:hypothetical protein [Chitinophagaceae bacterium LY-5]